MPTNSNSGPSKKGNAGNTAPEPKRIGWMPKCRAETFGDRRTKRNRTRGDQKRRWQAENL